MIKQRLFGLLATAGIVGFVLGVPLVLTAIGAVPSATTLDRVRDVLLSPDDGTLVIGMAAVVAWGAWAVMTLSLVVETLARLRGVRAPKLPGLSMPQVAAGQLIAVASLLFAGTAMVAPVLAPATAHAMTATPHEAAVAPLVPSRSCPSELPWSTPSWPPRRP